MFSRTSQKIKEVAGDRKDELDPVILLNVAFVLIVLALHHGTYTYDYIGPLRDLSMNKYFQKLAVGGFLFLSGYKLAVSKRATPPIPFLVSRFIRIYPPYFIALIAHSFTVYPQKYGELPSFKNFLYHATLLQSLSPSLVGGYYQTIWFVSILLCCYFLFIGTRGLLNKPRIYLLSVLSLAAVINLVRNILSQFEIDAFSNGFEIYLSLFASGMLYAAYQNRARGLLRSPEILFSLISIVAAIWLCFIVGLAADSLSSESNHVQIFNFASLLATTVPIYAIVLTYPLKVDKGSIIRSCLNIASSASFFVFLFHRPIWSVMQNLWVEETVVQSMYILLIGLPVIFFFHILVRIFTRN